VLDQAIVREHDAHAWVEVWFPNHGWVPVDPSPGFSALAATQFPNHWAASGIARLIPHLTIGGPIAALGSLGLLAAIPPAVVVAVLVTLLWAWASGRDAAVKGPVAWHRASPSCCVFTIVCSAASAAGEHRRKRRSSTCGRAWVLAPLLEEVTDAVNEGVYAGRWPDRARVREARAPPILTAP